MANLPKIEIAAASRPHGVWLTEQAIVAYAAFFFPEEMQHEVVDRLNAAPRYSDGSPKAQLWFSTRKDAEAMLVLMAARTGSPGHAFYKHR